VRVVVTGATGNVGTAVVEHLLATREDVEVVGLARRVPTTAPGLARQHDRLTWVSLDLSDDECRPVLRAALRGAEAVVHLAWGFQPSHDPDYLEELGVGGTRRVLETATEEQVAHLVHMSSVGAYSPKVDDTPVAEDYQTGGIASSMYSRHKASPSGSSTPTRPRWPRARSPGRGSPGCDRGSSGSARPAPRCCVTACRVSSRAARSPCCRCCPSIVACWSRWCTPLM